MVQRQHLKWDLILRFAILLLPMGFLGLWVARQLPVDATRILIGTFVLVATWTPQWLRLGTNPGSIAPHRRFVILGGVNGFLSVTVGATGSVLAPFS